MLENLFFIKKGPKENDTQVLNSSIYDSKNGKSVIEKSRTIMMNIIDRKSKEELQKRKEHKFIDQTEESYFKQLK